MENSRLPTDEGTNNDGHQGNAAVPDGISLRSSPNLDFYYMRNSPIYITISLGQSVIGDAIPQLLGQAAALVSDHIHLFGGGPIDGNGVFNLPARLGPFALHIWSTNGNVLTWQELQATVTLISGYLAFRGRFGAAMFTIYDGGREVGMGRMA